MDEIGVPLVRDSIGMLVGQACAALIWNQCIVPDAVMTHVMSHLLSHQAQVTEWRMMLCVFYDNKNVMVDGHVSSWFKVNVISAINALYNCAEAYCKITGALIGCHHFKRYFIKGEEVISL